MASRPTPSPPLGSDGRPSPTGSTPGPGQRQPFERLFDPHVQSASTFHSSFEDDSLLGGDGLDGPHTLSSWSEEMPQAISFPSNKPCSRADALVLDQWISTNFAHYAQRFGSSEEDLTKAVEELVPILSIGLHEIVRQVTQHCLERGVVLEKIWRTYVDLFERALFEAKASLRRQKDKATRMERELEQALEEVEQMRAKHPEQIAKLSRTLTGKFQQRQSVLEENLRQAHTENAKLSEHFVESMKSVQCWFPLFEVYKGSPLRDTLQHTPEVSPTNSSPESRISADMKRILQVMPPEGSRRVSYYISSLLGLRSTQLPTDSLEALTERREHNQQKIEQLEGRLAELQATLGQETGMVRRPSRATSTRGTSKHLTVRSVRSAAE